MIFSSISYKYFDKNNLNKFKYILIIFITIFSLKNLNRIILNEKNYFNYPWPKFYSYDSENKILNHEYKILNNKKIYFPKNGYCMYSKAPCGVIREGLKIITIRNYSIMLIDS